MNKDTNCEYQHCINPETVKIEKISLDKEWNFELEESIKKNKRIKHCQSCGKSPQVRVKYINFVMKMQEIRIYCPDCNYAVTQPSNNVDKIDEDVNKAIDLWDRTNRDMENG